MARTASSPRVQTSTRGLGRSFLIGSACLCTAVFAAAAAISVSSMRSAQPIALPLEGAELAGALVRVGITPDSLCAAGVSPSGTTQVVGDAEEFLGDRIESFRSAVNAADSSARELSRLERLVRSGASAQGLEAGQQLAQTSAAALAVLSEGLFAATVDDLSGEQVIALRNIHANRDRAGVPVEYLLITRTDSEWVALRDAVAHIRVCGESGVEPDAEVQIAIANANAVPAVAAARQNLQSNRQLCSNAFMAATLGE